MKYTVKISNLSFDMELIQKDENIPVVINNSAGLAEISMPETVIDKPLASVSTPESVIDKQSIPIDQDVFDFDLFLNGKSGIISLPSWMNGKEVVIKSKGMLKVSKSLILVGENTILTFESWEKSPIQLIDCEGSEMIAFVGITFVCPENRPLNFGAERQIFGWGRNKVKKGKFAYINGQEIKDKDRVTYGLSRFVYSSEGEENIYLIAKNIWHNGFNFMQAKNPYKGNLYTALINVNQHNPIVEFPQSHYYSRCSVNVRISVKNEVATIISDNTFDQILTWAGYNNGNQRSILYFDRFVYDISESKLIDNKNLKINSIDELQLADNVFGLGKVIQKQIDGSRKLNWVYTYEKNNLPSKEVIPEGEFDAFIIYKGNALFSNGHLNENTKFPEHEILSSQGYGWSWYCEELTGYIENFKGSGYYRNSSSSGISNGLTIVNSQFGLNPPAKTSVKPLNNEVKEFIEYLEAL